MVLLLHIGDDIERRRGRHGEAGGGAGGAVDEEVVLWQRHVESGEHEGHCRDLFSDWDSVASVEAA